MACRVVVRGTSSVGAFTLLACLYSLRFSCSYRCHLYSKNGVLVNSDLHFKCCDISYVVCRLRIYRYYLSTFYIYIYIYIVA